MARFCITTPIYYVNDVPHIGHAYTTIAADILARYHRMLGDDVFFLTGTDEHGKKVEQAAAAQGRTPRDLADSVHGRFRDLWRTLNISNDDFIRTTEDRHRRTVHDFWSRAKAAKDIFLGDYEGWYCTPCETFWTEKELIPESRPASELENAGTLMEGPVDPTGEISLPERQETIWRCPTCRRPTEKLRQPSYFFNLSGRWKYLVEHFEQHPDAIQPSSRRNEILAFLRGEDLRDLSISRTDFQWGIPVPDDSRHVIYVWFDALVNYLTATHYSPGREDFWPASIHLVGKDILRFHTVYWFAFLKSAGFPPPERVFAHGWWTVDGQKMSKSLGNVVDPFEVAQKYGTDPFRYFLFREVPFGQDGNYSNRLLEARINGDLANDLGNLLSRVVQVASKHFLDSRIPASTTHDPSTLGQDGTLLLVRREQVKKAYLDALGRIELQAALEAVWDLVREANGYVDRSRPWEHRGTPRGTASLLELLESLRFAGVLLQPFMPGISNRILHQILGREIFGSSSRPSEPETADLDRPYPFTKGCSIVKGAHLVERLDLASAVGSRESGGVPAAKMEQGGTLPKQAGVPTKEAKVTETTSNTITTSTITIDEFRKMDLRSATILEAEEVPGSKRLVKLKVDLGGESRQVVAGIRHVYTPAELPGKKVVLVANLAPAKIMGVESQGMVLAATDGDTLSLLSFDRDVGPGRKVK
ncbi:MAG: methionine--tRNA ligase [Nitrospirae bacterium]|nr:methionine--tRNA ligase [Nitrospirota bacterium]